MGLKEVVQVVVLAVVVGVVAVRGDEDVVIEGCTAPLVVLAASMMDVGQNAIAQPNQSYSDFVPYGVDYFGAPAGRFSNGRVISDFISLGMGYGLMEPSLNSVNPQFAHGVNFASSGARAISNSGSGSSAQGSGLFPLSIQVSQYKSFKARVDKAQAKHDGSLTHLPTTTKLDNAIHIMMHAHNDYLNGYTGNAASDDALVTEVIAAMESALRELYTMKSKTMIVMNVLPLGCVPIMLSQAGDKGWKFDDNSCVAGVDEVVQLHNTRLQELINNLRAELSWENLVTFDLYGFFMKVFLNPKDYGVKYPMDSCCGVKGAKYNNVPGIVCGMTGKYNGETVSAVACDNPTEHLVWDSLHPVESFAKLIAHAVLGGEYFSPSLSMEDACKAA